MADDAPTPPDKHPEDEPPTLLQAVKALLHDLPGLLTDRVRLFSLELRRATSALGQIVLLALVAAILCGTAWLALWIAVGVVLVKATGLGVGWACGVVIVINLAVAAWCGLKIRALMPLLALPATLRRMGDGGERREPAGAPAAPNDSRGREDEPVARERDATPAP
jgi:uncharacterized membrane protein YqjE